MSKGKDTESSGPTVMSDVMGEKLESGDREPQQPPKMKMAVNVDPDDEWERPRETIEEEIIDAEPSMSQAERLAFMQEPVVVYIQPNLTTKHPEPYVPVWVNGKGAEVYSYATKKWFSFGVLPVGVNVTTRRKYVEVLAAARAENVRTDTWKDTSGEAFNEIHREQAFHYGFTIVHDWNKEMGRKWFERVMQRRV